MNQITLTLSKEGRVAATFSHNLQLPTTKLYFVLTNEQNENSSAISLDYDNAKAFSKLLYSALND